MGVATLVCVPFTRKEEAPSNCTKTVSSRQFDPFAVNLFVGQTLKNVMRLRIASRKITSSRIALALSMALFSHLPINRQRMTRPIIMAVRQDTA